MSPKIIPLIGINTILWVKSKSDIKFRSTLKVNLRSHKIAFPKGLTHFWFHMRKLNGSIVIGFQPILCSYCTACAQEMDQNLIDKNIAIFRFKN